MLKSNVNTNAFSAVIVKQSITEISGGHAVRSVTVNIEVEGMKFET